MASELPKQSSLKKTNRSRQSITTSEWTLYIEIYQPLEEKIEESNKSVNLQIYESVIDYITKIYGRVGHKFNPKTLNSNQTYVDNFGDKYKADENTIYDIVSIKNIPYEIVELLKTSQSFEIKQKKKEDDVDIVIGEANFNAQNKTILIEFFVMLDGEY